MSPIPVIFNPAAKGTRARGLVHRIARLSERALLWPTETARHARELARQAVAQGYETVVAAGGDGTINEVVNGLAGTQTALGILPVGTMNVFASELGLPCGDLHLCWERIVSSSVRSVDLACVNGRHHFVQLAGIGFDAQVVSATTTDAKNTFGPLSYLFSGVRLAGRKPPQLRIQCPGKLREGCFVLIGNGRYYGGPFPVFHRARIDDGLFDVLVFKNLGYLDIVRYLHGMVFGTHDKLPDVEYFQTGSLQVSSDEPVPMEVDGEVIGELPAHIDIGAGALRVLC